MLAYALYLNDARIKAYVKSLESSGASVDVLAVVEEGKLRVSQNGRTRVLHLTTQYRGDNALLYVWSYLKFFFASLFALSYLSIRRRYDVVHVHNMPNLLVFAAVLPKLLGTKLMLDVHDLMPANYMAKFNVNEDHFVVKCLVAEQWISSLMVTHVFCADDSQREFLERVCRIPARKLSVVLNLPNEEIFGPVKKSGVNDHFELVYHGTIARRLGIDIMLAAVAKVPAAVPLHFSIYGAGDFLGEAVETARQLQLEDRVQFSRSFFAVEKIPEMVGNMDLGVIGNRRTLACDKFMLPVKLLEYVYLEIPVVVPRLEVIRRYFDEEMVKYYEPENVDDLARCIVELYQCPEQRQRLVKNASKFYDNYNWRRQADAYLGLLSSVANV